MLGYGYSADHAEIRHLQAQMLSCQNKLDKLGRNITGYG